MKVSEKQLIPLRRLVALPNNPRKITQQSLNRLCDSIRMNGYWEHRPAAVEPIEGTDRYHVLDGNQRLKALRRLKRKEMPCVIYTELTVEERNEIIIKMAERGVACNVHYKPLPMMTAYKNLGFDIADYPNAYDMYHNEITLPLNTKMRDEDVEYVIENFTELIK